MKMSDNIMNFKTILKNNKKSYIQGVEDNNNKDNNNKIINSNNNY